jgi:hypothetical protein
MGPAGGGHYVLMEDGLITEAAGSQVFLSASLSALTVAPAPHTHYDAFSVEKDVSAMSQEAVTIIIQALFRSSYMRDRFARHPLAVLAELQFCAGIDLTPDEIRALAAVDLQVWSPSARVTPQQAH